VAFINPRYTTHVATVVDAVTLCGSSPNRSCQCGNRGIQSMADVTDVTDATNVTEDVHSRQIQA
jgi:hypothetical protein